jgi:hypothetical protein
MATNYNEFRREHGKRLTKVILLQLGNIMLIVVFGVAMSARPIQVLRWRGEDKKIYLARFSYLSSSQFTCSAKPPHLVCARNESRNDCAIQ